MNKLNGFLAGVRDGTMGASRPADSMVEGDSLAPSCGEPPSFRRSGERTRAGARGPGATLLRAVCGVAVLTVCGWWTPCLHAVPPLPSFHYYGMLADEYGWPVLQGDGAVLILKHGTNECGRFTANELLGSGINYILEAPLDNASGSLYSQYAVRKGDTVTVSVLVGGIEQPLMGGSVLPVVGDVGDAVRVDLNMGTDADGDGLSDQWETALIINNSNGRYTTIYEVLPGDDFDGDRVSNKDEFGAGTAPEWAGDVFEANNWMQNANGLLALCFYTKQGMTYELSAAPPNLSGQDFAWARVPFRTSPSGSEGLNCTAAQSSRTFFYVTATNTYRLYRLEIIR